MPEDAQAIRTRLETDRRDLLDLSLRNPLLNYRPRVRGLEFVGESPPELFRLLVAEGKSMTFLPAPRPEPAPASEPGPPRGAATSQEGPAAGPTSLPDTDIPEQVEGPSIPDGSLAGTELSGPEPLAETTKERPLDLPPANPTDLKLQTSLTSEELQERLLAIAYAARTAIEEQGVNTLYLALGLLSWREADAPTRAIRAPLVLVPVLLERTGARERFRLRADGEDHGFNLSLIEKLRASFGIRLPEPAEGEGLNLAEYLDGVAETVSGQPGWGVEREAAVLGFFSFSKFLMYRDLGPTAWPETDRPERHPVVASLLGDGFDEPAPEVDDEDDPSALDRDPAASELRLVLDADGTQTRALIEARAGRNLVIQGPPGTGKSQTITNLIADAIGRGLRVLFVAEKRAALEVVKRRLDALGLGEACLELHSHKTGKKVVLDQLRRALDSGRPAQPREGDESLRRNELRDRLNAYAEAVSKPIGSSRVTPHEAIGQLLRLGSLDGSASWPRIELPRLPAWTAADYRRRRDRVERLQSSLAAQDEAGGHPFAGSRRASLLPGDGDRLREILRVARHATASLREAAAGLGRFLRQSGPTTRSACEQLLQAARQATLAAGWQGAQVHGEWLSRRDDLSDLLAAGQGHADLHQRFDPVLLPDAWDQDVSSTRQALNVHGRHWWRFLVGEFRRASDHVARLCRGAAPSRLDARLALLDAVLESRRLKAAIERQEALAARLFGRRWRAASSDWRALGELVQGMQRLHLDVREGRLPRGLLDFLADAPALAGLDTLAKAVEAALQSHESASRQLVAFLELDESARFGGGGGLADLGFAEQERLLDEWSRKVLELESLAAWNRQAQGCRDDELADLVALARTWPDAGRHLVSLFDRLWFEGLLRQAYAERPELGEFTGAAHGAAVDRFRELDRRAFVHDRAWIARAHWQRVPRHNAFGQLAVLRRELAKKARHLPLRLLMERAGNAAQAVAPVFLMSPLSVAAYLPPGGPRFDLVVFDEASQVRPIDAIGALLRAQQAVVVGDSRQLPPTSFFDRLTGGDDDRDDEESTVDVESILGLFAAQGAPERMLRWHYRSRHESLIAVSNHAFYDDRLVIFPSPDTGRSNVGLIHRHLPATAYDRGRTRTNPGEADVVAQAVLAFAREQLARPRSERLSLGVATFSAAQAQAIAERLERLRRAEPGCEEFFSETTDDPFFVKNLENVQGDERDVIYISVGYGRTAEGTVAMNFGPLNTEGGERRLNVLITRARSRCEVFTNLTADDLDTGRGRARGVRVLKTFLAFAQSGKLENQVGRGESEPGPFAEAVAARLSAIGCQIKRDIGLSGCRIDLAIAGPERADRLRLGLEGDGRSYREAGPARDRDRLRPQMLTGLGWRLHRLWGPDWLRDPDGECRRVQASLSEPGPPSSDPPVVASPVERHPQEAPEESAEESAEVLQVQPYVLAELDPAPETADRSNLGRDRYLAWVREVVRVEGPVHVSELARRIVEASGVKRIGPRLQEATDDAQEVAIRQGAIRRAGDFLWPADMVQPPLRDRGSLPPNSRRLELVPDEELVVAIDRVIRDGYGIPRVDVPAVVCRLLGFARMSDEMRQRVEGVLAACEAAGRFVTQGESLLVAAPGRRARSEGTGTEAATQDGSSPARFPVEPSGRPK